MGGPLVLDGIKIPYVSIGGAMTFPDSSVHFETLVTEEFAKQLGLTALGYVHPSTGDLYPNWQGLHFSTMGDWDFSAKNVIPDPESRRALAWQDQQRDQAAPRRTPCSRRRAAASRSSWAR